MKSIYGKIFIFVLFGVAIILGVQALGEFIPKLIYHQRVDPPPKELYKVYETLNEYTKELRITMEAELRAELKAEMKPKTIIKTEKVNVDSLISEAKTHWMKELELEEESELGNYVYIAESDTTIEIRDSTGEKTDEFTLHTEYHSPIPLHMASSFFHSISHTSYTKTIHTETTTVETEPSRFGFGIQATAGYELTRGQFSTMVGVGVSYKVGNVLPFGWLPFIGHGLHITAGFDPVLKVYGVNAGYGAQLTLYGG